MKHRTTYHTCKLRESLYIHYTQPRRGNRGLPAVLGSNSWDQCVTVRQQVEELYLPGALFTHAPLILICLCAALHPHHHNHFSRFITPTTSSLLHLLPPLPRLPSPQYVRPVGLRQQPSAVRYSSLSSPPGKEKKKRRGHTSELCWFGTVSRTILYHPPHDAALLPGETAEHLTVARCAGQGWCTMSNLPLIV